MLKLSRNICRRKKLKSLGMSIKINGNLIFTASETGRKGKGFGTVGEAELGGRYCSAQPEAYEPRGASSNNCTVMLGHFPKLISTMENDPSSEPDDYGNPIGSRRTPNITLTDSDGIYDGTEIGLTSKARDTNVSMGYFVIDCDPTSTTKPNDDDSDDDGLNDWLELASK